MIEPSTTRSRFANLQLENFELAFQDINEGIRLNDSEDPADYRNRAYCLRQFGRREEAMDFHTMRRARVAPGWPTPSLTHRGRSMQETSRVFVGLDIVKLKISVALAEKGRQGEVRVSARAAPRASKRPSP